MNKKLVDALLPDAVVVLKEIGVANEKNEIPKTFRGQISSFAAAVSTGSLLAAAAFFNDQANAKSDRSKLVKSINVLLKKHGLTKAAGTTLFDTIRSTPAEKQRKLKEDVLACAVALKLAMNLYTLNPTITEKAGD